MNLHAPRVTPTVAHLPPIPYQIAAAGGFRLGRADDLAHLLVAGELVQRRVPGRLEGVEVDGGVDLRERRNSVRSRRSE